METHTNIVLGLPRAVPPPRPLISVITVCFNAAEFIEQCMQSVLSQECNDFEYVVIDGGSTDGTREIIEKYGDKLAYWHSRPDRGLAHAFNQGVEHSNGQWLLFLNSDDYFCNAQALAGLAEAARRHADAEVIYGQVVFVTREADPQPIGNPFGAPFQWREFVTRNIIPHPAALTRRDYFERVGRFDERFQLAFDYELFLRGGAAFRAEFVQLRVAFMREGGVSRQSVRASLKEWRAAQALTGALPAWRATLLYYALLLRSSLGRVVRLVQGYFSGR